jgi:GNAT superfamily N-acetyltransferase
VIRDATRDDVEAIVAVFEPSFATLDFLPVLHTHEDHLGFFGRLVERADVFLHEDGAVRGFAALDGDMLSHLYVVPAAFGRGVGSALFAEATRRRPDGFTFWVFQANQRARRFYEARGCVPVRFTDGAGNEERTPDALYEWRPSS